MTHWFEDMPVGFTFRTASRALSRDEIVDFAKDWDPQPFHLDEAAAAESHFGGLIASGWQTLLVAFRLTLEAGIWTEASMGASGLDEVRWLRPLFPGAEIHVESEVIAAERSASRPDRGRLRIRNDIFTADGVKVASYIGNHLIRTRP